MRRRKLSIGFAGARWLGINCLSYLNGLNGVEITRVCFPKKDENVWWKDLVDEDELKKMGFRITPWSKWHGFEFDLVFSVLHGRIFKNFHLQKSRHGVVNLHPAPLPQYRGCNSYAHAIMNGDRNYRVTMHYVDDGIDDGPIIGQNIIKMEKRDTGFSLYQKSQISALKLFKQLAPKIVNSAIGGKLMESRVQDETRANYYKRDSLSNKEVDLSWERRKLYNFIRALDFPPFEPAYFLLNGEKIYIPKRPGEPDCTWADIGKEQRAESMCFSFYSR